MRPRVSITLAFLGIGFGLGVLVLSLSTLQAPESDDADPPSLRRGAVGRAVSAPAASSPSRVQGSVEPFAARSAGDSPAQGWAAGRAALLDDAPGERTRRYADRRRARREPVDLPPEGTDVATGGVRVGGGTGRPRSTSPAPLGASESMGEDVAAPEPEAGAGDPDGGYEDPELVRLEEAAARAAESLGLVDPALLEFRVEQRVPAGSVPLGRLEEARAVARRQILADAALAESLARARDDASWDPSLRGWAQTLVPAADPVQRVDQLERAAESLDR